MIVTQMALEGLCEHGRIALLDPKQTYGSELSIDTEYF